MVVYSPTEQDKHREEVKKKLSLKPFSQAQLEQLAVVLRVRFERKEQSEKKSEH